MPWSTADIPDLSGRTALVTGGNGGLGLETARALARAGAHVIVAARNAEKTRAAAERIREETPGASLESVPLDLARLASVREAALRVAAAHERLDLLVNNAGLMATPEQRTADGFEMQLGVNHLGHWALTAHLLPLLLRADAARVVSVTSFARHIGRALDPANPHLAGRYGPWKAYGRSKLANHHFALGLQRCLAAAGARAASLAAHPGFVHTGIQATSVVAGGGSPTRRFVDLLGRTTATPPAHGALSQLRAATDPRARGGELYAPRFVLAGPPVRVPVLRRVGLSRAIETLWEVSRRETGVALDVEAAQRAA